MFGLSDYATAIVFFIIIIALTLGITAWASMRNKSTSDHYVAGGKISGWQNGLAVSGDYLSAASFLGIAGAIALQGFAGFYLSIGFLGVPCGAPACGRALEKPGQVHPGRHAHGKIQQE